MTSGSTERATGRYEVLDEIASGGMATVHLGWLTAPGERGERFVAIKRMHEHFALDPDFSSMFLDEAMMCMRIEHENVVRTLEVGHAGDELELVLELVLGESLSFLQKRALQKKQRLPRPIASRVMIDVLRGLHAAHDAKSAAGEPLMMVHRDVSPHNVMVGTDGMAKVLDFGVAKAVGRMQVTQAGQLKGKLGYMSPEQARAKPVDRRSDVFAAGVILWELLVGKRLYEGEHDAAVLTALLVDTPPAPSAKDATLASLDPLLARALATEADARFPSALAFAEAIEQAMRPATRKEVGAYVESEAKSSLDLRRSVMRRAEERFTPKRPVALRGLVAAPPPPPPKPPPAPLLGPPPQGPPPQGAPPQRDAGRPETTRPEAARTEPPSAALAAPVGEPKTTTLPAFLPPQAWTPPAAHAAAHTAPLPPRASQPSLSAMAPPTFRDVPPTPSFPAAPFPVTAAGGLAAQAALPAPNAYPPRAEAYRQTEPLRAALPPMAREHRDRLILFGSLAAACATLVAIALIALVASPPPRAPRAASALRARSQTLTAPVVPPAPPRPAASAKR